MLGPSGFTARSDPPVIPPGPLGAPPVLPVSLGSPVCPLVPLVSLLVLPHGCTQNYAVCIGIWPFAKYRCSLFPLIFEPF
jgi:hypothetical protein